MAQRLLLRANAAIGRGADARRGGLSLEWFLRELSGLGLYARTFTPAQYVENLGNRLGIAIRIEYLEDVEHPRAAQMLAHDGLVGCVCRDAVTGDALILVPRSLGPDLETRLIYHEAGHVAAGHPVPESSLLGAGPVRSATDGLWVPETRLDRRRPPADATAWEREARTRAQYAFLAGRHGAGLLEDGDLGPAD